MHVQRPFNWNKFFSTGTSKSMMKCFSEISRPFFDTVRTDRSQRHSIWAMFVQSGFFRLSIIDTQHMIVFDLKMKWQMTRSRIDTQLEQSSFSRLNGRNSRNALFLLIIQRKMKGK
ncbi:Hypothetical_protein [Hexamita inflata]|uniref:Hypothetical_protein n=1 Tax=Hexamita inflata TaxID=28002 RepID=A0AA86R849_9EUKA|nr:Hypothetical protein HINF_LOCUS50712 [Hexamita inflata]CAI9969051.1 Hypothetical protein HINF_LOCUS56696 [Hexamita inflata]